MLNKNGVETYQGVISEDEEGNIVITEGDGRDPFYNNCPETSTWAQFSPYILSCMMAGYTRII